MASQTINYPTKMATEEADPFASLYTVETSVLNFQPTTKSRNCDIVRELLSREEQQTILDKLVSLSSESVELIIGNPHLQTKLPFAGRVFVGHDGLCTGYSEYSKLMQNTPQLQHDSVVEIRPNKVIALFTDNVTLTANPTIKAQQRLLKIYNFNNKGLIERIHCLADMLFAEQFAQQLHKKSTQQNVGPSADAQFSKEQFQPTYASPAVDVVKQSFAHFGTQDWNQMMTIFSPDIVMTSGNTSTISKLPYLGVFKGHDGARECLTSIVRVFPQIRLEFDDLVQIAPNKVLIIMREYITNPNNNQVGLGYGFHVYTVNSSNKICHIEAYCDFLMEEQMITNTLISVPTFDGPAIQSLKNAYNQFATGVVSKVVNCFASNATMQCGHHELKSDIKWLGEFTGHERLTYFFNELSELGGRVEISEVVQIQPYRVMALLWYTSTLKSGLQWRQRSIHLVDFTNDYKIQRMEATFDAKIIEQMRAKRQ